MHAIDTDPAKARRAELILSQIESLPTLPSIAVRLLALTTSDESEVREVVDLIEADPTLSARILSLCRQADLGVRGEFVTVEKAVMLLGFNTVRNAVLSIKVVDLFRAKENSPDGNGQRPRFRYTDFWHHCLAVAIMSEQIARAHKASDIPAGEAFVCGLLHDLGKLALDHMLPHSYERVIELVETHQGNIAEFERRIIGIDHHTAGKRLAEQWQLPHMLQDCIWLHGCPIQMLPELEHHRMIALVSVADLIARQQHVGYSGNFEIRQDAAQLARQVDFDPKQIDAATQRLHEEVELRSRALGLEERPTGELFLSSIQRANQMLGRVNRALERRTQTASKCAQLLDTVRAFHANAVPGQRVQDVLGTVVDNAVEVFGPGYYAMIYQSQSDQPWLFCQYNHDGEYTKNRLIDPPPHSPDLVSIDTSSPTAMSLLSILPWIADYMVNAPDLRSVKLLPLACGWGTPAILLHDRPSLPPWRLLESLAYTWGSAVADSTQHDGARRMGEKLAEMNRVLAETQERLLHSESMTRLGEMAAGAAHEMNNPLAIISGRSQLLASSLDGGSEQWQAAQTIVEQAYRLSDLITSLRLFADPPAAKRRLTELSLLLEEITNAIRKDVPRQNLPVSLRVQRQLPQVLIDPELIGGAVRELMLNALQAGSPSSVHLTARMDGQRLIIQVDDDGPGMDARTLSHAMDPFFSAKAAGRRAGMGLPRAQQWVVSHGGTLDLSSQPGHGTTATLAIPLDSPQ